MALEFENLREEVEKMALSVVGRQRRRETRLQTAVSHLNRFAHNWQAIRSTLIRAEKLADEKYFRAARPLDETVPLNAAINPPLPPSQAIIISADGSQILPERHAAYLYYLINVGGIIYYHGSSQPPDVFSHANLEYPEDDIGAVDFASNSGRVSIERDLMEIGTLAIKAHEQRNDAQQVLAVVDQRLLYFPFGDADAANHQAIDRWLEQMAFIREYGALLAGYVDQSSKILVTSLLAALSATPSFDWKMLGRREATEGLTDAELFSHFLKPGQRSKTFVEVSQPNRRFAEKDPHSEICFFYFNPGGSENQVARVDIPMWVAKDETAVNLIHALLYDQCQIMGGYPYVITRADEIARVRRQDQEELNFMIELAMQRQGIDFDMTAKQRSKSYTGHGRTPHTI
ncbi:MAG: DNA double-strand break repair nuclease NurA [Chloroflexota bacterium]